ncbi:T9SS type A sorting domain-containing protein [Tamlana sp. I1]|uniref:T9SS type A sorting domain-containing protein n=1 Tax=Tamlana sp. I1 TaxID=2762061 RepID=UPI0018906EA1|nr:T9SS type A sorting domain-containing protein [Tamlana sp. I1]
MDLQNISCEGACDGEIIVFAENGVPPYEYSLNYSSYPFFQHSEIFSDLCPGHYEIFVRDSNGLEAFLNVDISEPAVLEPVIDVLASGNSPSGILNMSASGGTAPYNYTINGGSFISNHLVSDLEPKTYAVIVLDDNGCSVTKTVTVNQVDFDNSVIVNGNVLIANSDADSYQWINVTTQKPIDGETNHIFNATDEGEYRVEMEVTIPVVTSKSYQKESQLRSTQTVTVSSPSYQISNVLAVAPDETLEPIIIFPNPAESYIKLPTSLIGKDYIIFSTLGKVVNSGEIKRELLSIESLVQGMYYLKIKGVIQVSKFIKR